TGSSTRAEGEARGEAKALLAVLAARGIDVPKDAHERPLRGGQRGGSGFPLLAAVLAPAGVVDTLGVGAPVGVRAEEVPLRLDQVRRQPLRPQAVVVGQ